MKNYQELFKKIASWLKVDGLLFAHVFCHKNVPYHFETDENHSWMAKYFFTGGTMPSADLFLYFQDYISIQQHWFIDGSHYGKTSEAWLKNLDKNEHQALLILETAYGKEQAKMWLNRWRLFFIAVAETFNFCNGEEWGVCLYLFKKK